jgi:hypothetical protein
LRLQVLLPTVSTAARRSSPTSPRPGIPITRPRASTGYPHRAVISSPVMAWFGGLRVCVGDMSLTQRIRGGRGSRRGRGRVGREAARCRRGRVTSSRVASRRWRDSLVVCCVAGKVRCGRPGRCEAHDGGAQIGLAVEPAAGDAGARATAAMVISDPRSACRWLRARVVVASWRAAAAIAGGGCCRRVTAWGCRGLRAGMIGRAVLHVAEVVGEAELAVGVGGR